MCDAYDDPAVVALYDRLNPLGPEEGFYTALTAGVSSVLDIGCGTGLLTARLKCRRIVAADPSPAMLSVAQARPELQSATFVAGRAGELVLSEPCELAMMTGHVAQHFLTELELSAAFKAVRDAIAPSGLLAFETRNPRMRAWRSWTPELSLRRVRGENGEDLTVYHRLVSTDLPLVTFETTYALADGDCRTTRSTLRFWSAAEIEALLCGAGFGSLQMFGNWDRAPLTAVSPEIIVIACPSQDGLVTEARAHYLDVGAESE